MTDSYVKLVYRTEVSADADGIVNTMQIGTDGNSATSSVNYQKNQQHSSNKWGDYVSVENADGSLSEFIDWTIEVKANDGATASLNNLITKPQYADIRYGIKLAERNIGFNGKFYTFPYFLTFLLKRFLRENPFKAGEETK